METQLSCPPDLLRLLERENEIRHAMRRPGGIRITVERELHAIREQLKTFPATASAERARGAGAHGPQS